VGEWTLSYCNVYFKKIKIEEKLNTTLASLHWNKSVYNRRNYSFFLVFGTKQLFEVLAHVNTVFEMIPVAHTKLIDCLRVSWHASLNQSKHFQQGFNDAFMGYKNFVVFIVKQFNKLNSIVIVRFNLLKSCFRIIWKSHFAINLHNI